MSLTTGSFHLLHLMFDDYVLYLVENLYSQERSRDFLRRIKGEITGLIHYCIIALLYDPKSINSVNLHMNLDIQ